MVMLLPLTLYAWVRVLTNLFRYLKYRLAGHQEQIKYNIKQTKQPILVLNYKIPLKFILLIMTCILVTGFYFFQTDADVRKDLNKLFFSFSEEQTYILYYWAWKINLGSLHLFSVFVALIMFNRKVSFYKNIVILENTLFGKKSFVLDDNLKFSKESNGIRLYNELSATNIVILNKKLMEKMDSQQEKLLYEFLSNIPEKHKYFYP